MYKRTCSNCNGVSHSSYNDPNWKCPYCGAHISVGDNPSCGNPEQWVNDMCDADLVNLSPTYRTMRKITRISDCVAVLEVSA